MVFGAGVICAHVAAKASVWKACRNTKPRIYARQPLRFECLNNRIGFLSRMRDRWCHSTLDALILSIEIYQRCVTDILTIRTQPTRAPVSWPEWVLNVAPVVMLV